MSNPQRPPPAEEGRLKEDGQSERSQHGAAPIGNQPPQQQQQQQQPNGAQQPSQQPTHNNKDGSGNREATPVRQRDGSFPTPSSSRRSSDDGSLSQQQLALDERTMRSQTSTAGADDVSVTGTLSKSPSPVQSERRLSRESIQSVSSLPYTENLETLPQQPQQPTQQQSAPMHHNNNKPPLAPSPSVKVVKSPQKASPPSQPLQQQQARPKHPPLQATKSEESLPPNMQSIGSAASTASAPPASSVVGGATTTTVVKKKKGRFTLLQEVPSSSSIAATASDTVSSAPPDNVSIPTTASVATTPPAQPVAPTQQQTTLEANASAVTPSQHANGSQPQPSPTRARTQPQPTDNVSTTAPQPQSTNSTNATTTAAAAPGVKKKGRFVVIGSSDATVKTNATVVTNSTTTTQTTPSVAAGSSSNGAAAITSSPSSDSNHSSPPQPPQTNRLSVPDGASSVPTPPKVAPPPAPSMPVNQSPPQQQQQQQQQAAEVSPVPAAATTTRESSTPAPPAPVVRKKGRFVITSVTDPNTIGQPHMVPVLATPIMVSAPPPQPTAAAAGGSGSNGSTAEKAATSPTATATTTAGLVYAPTQAAVMMTASGGAALVPQPVMYAQTQPPPQPTQQDNIAMSQPQQEPQPPQPTPVVPAPQGQTGATSTTASNTANGETKKDATATTNSNIINNASQQQQQQAASRQQTTTRTTTRPGLASQQPRGLGKAFYFLDQMRAELLEQDRSYKSLQAEMRSMQTDMKFLKEKNKELEAKARDAERALKEERNLRESSESKLKALRKRMRELQPIMNGASASAVERLVKSDSVADPSKDAATAEFFQAPPAVMEASLSEASNSNHNRTSSDHAPNPSVSQPLQQQTAAPTQTSMGKAENTINSTQGQASVMPSNGSSHSAQDTNKAPNEASKSTVPIAPKAPVNNSKAPAKDSKAQPPESTRPDSLQKTPSTKAVAGTLSPPREAVQEAPAPASNSSRKEILRTQSFGLEGQVTPQQQAALAAKSATSSLGKKAGAENQNSLPSMPWPQNTAPPLPQRPSAHDFDPLLREKSTQQPQQNMQKQPADTTTQPSSSPPFPPLSHPGAGQMIQPIQPALLMMEQQAMAYPYPHFVGVANVEGVGMPAQNFVQMEPQPTPMQQPQNSMPGYQDFAPSVAPGMFQMMTIQQPIIQWEETPTVPGNGQAPPNGATATTLPRSNKSVTDFDPLQQNK